MKLSYCCMPNVATILKSHNQRVLKQQQDDPKESASCNCRNKTNCPLPGNCQVTSVVYQANVTTESGALYSYIGLTENTFKKRWSGHCQSFKNEAYENSTELSKLIWRLKRDNTKYNITWQILTRSQPYRPGQRGCSLCLSEKLLILKNSGKTINSRSELVSKCRHARKFLIRYSC